MAADKNSCDWTPAEALSAIRKCRPSECEWVFGSELANKRMSKSEAFRCACEYNRDL